MKLNAKPWAYLTLIVLILQLGCIYYIKAKKPEIYSLSLGEILNLLNDRGFMAVRLRMIQYSHFLA